MSEIVSQVNWNSWEYNENWNTNCRPTNYCPYWQLKFSFLTFSMPVQFGGGGQEIGITAILWSVFSSFYEHAKMFSYAEHFMKDKKLCQPHLHLLNLNKRLLWQANKRQEIGTFTKMEKSRSCYGARGFLRNGLHFSQHQGQNYWHSFVILPPILTAQSHPSCINCYPSFWASTSQIPAFSRAAVSVWSILFDSSCKG